MTTDAPTDRRAIKLAIVAAVIVAALAGLLVYLNRDTDTGPDTAYAKADVLTKDGALKLKSPWVQALEDCNDTELSAVATENAIKEWKRAFGDGNATSVAQACQYRDAGRQYKRLWTITDDTDAEPEFSTGIPPTLTMYSRAEYADFLGGNRSVETWKREVTFVRGSDGYWRVDSDQWAD